MEQSRDVRADIRPGPLTSDIYSQKSEKCSLLVTSWSFKMGADRLFLKQEVNLSAAQADSRGWGTVLR